MPGEESLKTRQYYAHPRNAFWHIMGKLFGASPSLPYQERVVLLQSTGVALWDCLKACKRQGSLDASISDEVTNDFPAFFAKYPNISNVFFNGSKSETIFCSRVLPNLTEDQHSFTRLPSTSPAHAAMTLEGKLQAWSVVSKVLSTGRIIRELKSRRRRSERLGPLPSEPNPALGIWVSIAAPIRRVWCTY